MPRVRETSRHHALTLRVSLALVLGLAGSVALAKPTQPDTEDRQITNAVRARMEGLHLSGRRVDDTISERCMDAFLKSLDPWKLYFYQSDVDEFQANRDKLDDWIRGNDVSYAYTIFARFLARVQERTRAPVL